MEAVKATGSLRVLASLVQEGSIDVSGCETLAAIAAKFEKKYSIEVVGGQAIVSDADGNQRVAV